MENTKFTNQLYERRNEILNFISNNTEDKFIFNFLSKKEYVGSMKIGTREQWSGAHCRVLSYKQDPDNSFKSNVNQKGYYITFNTMKLFADNNVGNLAFSLRTDLVHYWNSCDTTNLYVLVISKYDDKIYEIPVKRLLGYVCSEAKKDPKVSKVKILNKESMYHDFTIELTNDIVSIERTQIHDEYEGNYNADYYKPEYISHFTYSIYRCKNAVRVFSYDKKTMKLNGKKDYRSIKELYDDLKKKSLYYKTYKSLQRDIAKEASIDLGKVIIIATTDLEKDPALFEAQEIVDKTIPNPFFNEFAEEGPCNPKRLVVESHFESKQLDPSTDEYKQKFEEEYHCDEIEETFKELEKQLPKDKQKELKDYYEKSMYEDISEMKIINEITGEYNNFILYQNQNEECTPLF